MTLIKRVGGYLAEITTCSLRDSMNLLLKMNLKVIGVSKDSEKSHINFTSKYNLNFDLASDENKRIIKLYGVLNEKGSASRKSFLLDKPLYST